MTDTSAEDFAEIARRLHDEPDLEQTLDRILERGLRGDRL